MSIFNPNKVIYDNSNAVDAAVKQSGLILLLVFILHFHWGKIFLLQYVLLGALKRILPCFFNSGTHCKVFEKTCNMSYAIFKSIKEFHEGYCTFWFQYRAQFCQNVTMENILQLFFASLENRSFTPPYVLSYI